MVWKWFWKQSKGIKKTLRLLTTDCSH